MLIGKTKPHVHSLAVLERDATSATGIARVYPGQCQQARKCRCEMDLSQTVVLSSVWELVRGKPHLARGGISMSYK